MQADKRLAAAERRARRGTIVLVWMAGLATFALLFGAAAHGAPLRPDDGLDDTAALLRAIASDTVVHLKPGRYQLDWSQLRGRPELEKFAIIGAAPATTWQQPVERSDKTLTEFYWPDAPAEEWLIDWQTPRGGQAGPQQMINVANIREENGNGFRFRGSEAATPTNSAGRGVLLRDTSFHVGREAKHWTREFTGDELPDIRGTWLYLENQYDGRVEGCSAWGNEDQLVFKDSDYLRVMGWHGGNCGRSIVSLGGMVHSLVDAPHIENVVVVGIDAADCEIRSPNVEVGYWVPVGVDNLPKEVRWSVEAGSDRVSVSGVDPRKWIARWSTVRLGDKYLLRVESVDERGFTFTGADQHCKLPAISGDGAGLYRYLGVCYQLHGDRVSLDSWTANLNQRLPGLPVYAAWPHRSTIYVTKNRRQLGKWWDAGNDGQVGGWSERQFSYGGDVYHEGDEFRPDHPWVHGPTGPKFNANKREAVK